MVWKQHYRKKGNTEINKADDIILRKIRSRPEGCCSFSQLNIEASLKNPTYLMESLYHLQELGLLYRDNQEPTKWHIAPESLRLLQIHDVKAFIAKKLSQAMENIANGEEDESSALSRASIRVWMPLIGSFVYFLTDNSYVFERVKNGGTNAADPQVTELVEHLSEASRLIHDLVPRALLKSFNPEEQEIIERYEMYERELVMMKKPRPDDPPRPRHSVKQVSDMQSFVNNKKNRELRESYEGKFLESQVHCVAIIPDFFFNENMPYLGRDELVRSINLELRKISKQKSFGSFRKAS